MGVRSCFLDQKSATNQKSVNRNSEITNQKSSASPRLSGEECIHERTLHVPVPMRDPKVFLKLLQMDLNVSPPASPVQKVWLRAEPVIPRITQGGLFLPSAPPPEKLELMLARIAGILECPPQSHGDAEGVCDLRFVNCDLVVQSRNPEITNQKSSSASPRLRGGANPQWLGSPELLNTHRPGAFRIHRFVPPQASPGDSACNAPERAPALPVTALRVLRPPVVVTVELRNQSLVRLRCENRAAFRGEVIWSAGPWRSSGEWWRKTFLISDFRIPI